MKKRPLVIAHRGASAYAPENTLEAFEAAVSMRADGIATHVDFTREKKIVLNHDIRLERTSNAQGAIPDYDLAELKQFDFGVKFYGERRGIRIPTLEELFDLLKPTDLMINLEIKDDDPGILECLLQIEKNFGMADRVLYSSFNHLQLWRMTQLNPQAKTGVLYGMKNLPLVNAARYAGMMNAYSLHPRASMLELFPTLVEDAHNEGLAIYPYTVDTEDMITDFVQKGCDGLITNQPDVVNKVFRPIFDS